MLCLIDFFTCYLIVSGNILIKKNFLGGFSPRIWMFTSYIVSQLSDEIKMNGCKLGISTCSMPVISCVICICWSRL